MDYIKLETSKNELRVIFLKNELVFNSTSFILESILKAAQAGNPGVIVLDLRSIDYIDSSAVGMFINLKNQMQKKGKKLVLEGLKENVLRIFHFLEIADFLELTAA